MAKYKHSNEQTIGEALELWLDRMKLRRGVEDASVLQAWDAVMGPSITRQTTRKKFQNGVLVVQLENSVVRSELLAVRMKIIDALNEQLGSTVVKQLELY